MSLRHAARTAISLLNRVMPIAVANRLKLRRDPALVAAPRKIRLEAAGACQLRCPSCPTTTGAIRPIIGAGLLKIADFRALLDANPTIEQVELSNYGEVFLNPDLLAIFEYADRKGVAITLSNGANLNNVKTETLEGLVKYNVRSMTCSIDGASPETYRIYRVRGHFERVIANIEAINAYKRALTSPYPALTWQFVVFGHNEHEIPKAREMAERLGMAFYTKLTWDDAFSPIRDKDFVRAQTSTDATTRAEFEAIHGQKYAATICAQLWDAPQINWDGKMLGCCRNFWGDFGGNAFREGLAESFNGEKMTYARDMLTGRQPERADIPCSTCELYHDMRHRDRFIVRA